MSRLRDGWQARRGRWWWLAALILVPVVLGSTLSVTLLLALVDAATVTDQIDLIKTGLAIGAGTGGAVGLVLAGRRQWSTEQAHRVAEQSAADARHDATERRITDLYSKAADQLGSDKAAVRLAGLYSLERLAQDTPALRQTVVNLLCAYLRMPSEVSSDQEIEVRGTIQRIFSVHLRLPDGRATRERFWPDIDLDLTGAELHFFDLFGARLRHGSFGGVTFSGWTRFDNAEFTGSAIFGGARFVQSATFRSARFGAEARFRGAEFSGPANFEAAVFDGPALFGGRRDGQPDGAVFRAVVTFTGATFAQSPVFEHVEGSVELD